MGYEIQIVESIFLKINSKEISEKSFILWLKHIKKEESDMLFGFLTKDERDFFVEILNIKGIGSQIAMSLLNKFSLDEIINAISENDNKLISSVKGVGHKMSERIILELKSKLISKHKEQKNKDQFQFLNNNSQINSILEDVNLTLQSLNYPKKEIKNVLPFLIGEIKIKKNSISAQDYISFENLLKIAMNYLEKNNSDLVQ